MKRQMFRNFYFVFVLWLIAFGATEIGQQHLDREIFRTAYWIGNLLAMILGVYLVYKAGRWASGLFASTGNQGADTMVQVSFILGFAVLIYIGLYMNWLAPMALIVAPFYALWNLYRYMTV